MASFVQWRETRSKIDSCPWAGPRPLRLETVGDERQFVGRSEDEEKFLLEVLDHDLVILSAESGVGKTSMLEMALIPSMRSAGYVPLYCDSWTAPEDGEAAGFDIDRFFFDEFKDHVSVDGFNGFRTRLDDELGARGILILDQFEELIRYHPAVFESIVRWIAEAVAEHDFKIVVAMRSEYVHKLRKLDELVGPWDMSRYVLETVSDDEDIRELIESANEATPGTIDLEASGAITDLWRRPAKDGTRPGLLDLHALLYALYWAANDEDRSIDLELVDQFIKSSAESSEEGGPDLFRHALDQTVRRKLELCEQAMSDGNDPLTQDSVQINDTYLRDGTRGAVEQIVQHLSSGGYKLLREEWELAQRALQRELSLLLGRTSEALGVLGKLGAEEMFRQVGRLSDTGDGVGQSADLLTSRLDIPIAERYEGQLALEGNPWEVDAGELSSGPMLGINPLFILVEEFRRFHFGIQWLLASDLIRTTSPMPNQTMVSLIHDGFGRALDHWAASRSKNPASEITRLTASKGETLDWLLSDDGVWSDFEGRTIVNVRWRDCEIRARFKNTVFVNCDFRGSRFVRCSFEGAMFINCLLDGASITDSQVVGPVNSFRKKYPKDVAPSFEVPLERGEVELFKRYRGIRVEETGGHSSLYSLISHTSGMPAVPMDERHGAVFPDTLVDGQPWRIPWRRETGGLAMYGGRLCSLRLHRTRFIDGGMFAVRLVSGSALDLVEHAEGELSIDIYGSAIRGLTITGSSTSRSGNPVSLKLVSEDAVLADTWLGDGLAGTAEFSKTILWHMMSLSRQKQGEFDIRFSDCGYYGLVNVGDLGESTLIEEFSSSSIARRSEKVRTGARMDYQSDPARGEYERRSQEAPNTLWPPLVRLSETDG